MSFSRVNGPGWAVGDKLTSAQQNALDIDHANAADKTTANDTIAATWTFSAATAALAFSGSSVGITMATATQLLNLGAGKITLTGAGVANINSGGQLIVASGGFIVLNAANCLTTGTPGAIQLNGGPTDYLNYGGGRSYNKSFALIPYTLATGWTIGSSNIRLAGPATNAQQMIALPFMHNGARLQSVTMSIEVVAHSNVPAVMPKFDVRRKGIVAGAETDVSLFSTGPQAFPTPGSGAAWAASGNVQLWSATPDQNFTIDTTQFVYYLVLIDENGANSAAGNSYLGGIMNFSAIANSAPA